MRYHSAGPDAGLLACDRVGTGRMSEPAELIPYITSLLHTQGKRDLTDKTVLISAGGVKEFFDPVRFIGNPATGKMGLALAQAAVHRGANVILVYGTLPDIPIDDRITKISATTSAQMQQQMLANFAAADLVLMSAAVADVKPANYSPHKLPKKLLPTELKLANVPDIIAQLSQLKQPHQRLIGFAAQTGDIITPALEKLNRKKLDAIVTNPVDLIDSGFGTDRNQAVLLKQNGESIDIPSCTKLAMAHLILDNI